MNRDSGLTLIELLIIVVILGIVGGIVVFALNVYNGDGTGNEVQNTDPRAGWVEVDNSVSKKCDGTTMLYRDSWEGGITASANNEECRAG